jgi:HAE1 family hydrophobic/amphiphilic exporter-1
VDRNKAESLNVPVSSVYTTLQTFLGGSEVNDFNAFGRTWKVVMQADKIFRGDVRNMNMFYVRSNSGSMIPLDALVTNQFDLTVPVVTRFNGASAFKIAGSPASRLFHRSGHDRPGRDCQRSSANELYVRMGRSEPR